jgi:hypothetical protein
VPKQKAASVNRRVVQLPPQMRRAPNRNVNKTLRYQTTAPRLVNKRYVPRPNGGFTLEYNLKNAKIVAAKKPTLKFIQIAKLISPKRIY